MRSAIYYGPDSEGHNGVYLGLNVVTEASAALTKALWKVGPRIMNWGQIAAFLRHAARTKLAAATGSPRPEAFRPRFSECVEHFLIHAGQ